MKDTILASRENFREVVSEMEFAWVVGILSCIPNVNVENVLPESGKEADRTFTNILELRQVLLKNKIEISKDQNDTLVIYLQGEPVAFYKKPIYRLKQDLASKDKAKRYYIEIDLEYSSVFDEEEENG